MALPKNAELDALQFAEQASDPATPASGFGRLYVKADGVYFIDDAGTVTGPLGVSGGGGAGGSIPTVSARRLSGNITCNSTTRANLDTGLDLTLPAAAGDVIEASLSAFAWNEAVAIVLDVATVVAGSPVNYFGAGSTAAEGTFAGIAGSYGPPSVYMPQGWSVTRTLVAGDISGGNVTLRLRYQTATAGNKQILAAGAYPLDFTAKNLGQ